MLIFSTITSLKIPFTKQEDDLKTGYTPAGARSHKEFAMYEEFYAKKGSEPINIMIFIVAKKHENLATISHLNATVDLMDNLAQNFYLKNLNFYQFCSDFCEFNEPIRHFRVCFPIQIESKSF